jgi:hypothetical protein
MPQIDKNAELPSPLRFRPIPQGDWIDMEFVLQEVEQELRGEVLAVALETMANVHQNVAEGARKVANLIRGGGGGGAQQKR